MPGAHIHGIDLARFLVRQVEDREYLRGTPFLANPKK
jgi:hypothetical protein